MDREVVERGLPVLLVASAASASSGVLTEELRVLPAAEALLLLASTHAALKICLAHRTRWVSATVILRRECQSQYPI